MKSRSGEKSRDIFAEHQKKNLCYGLEIETESDYSMPERIFIYDACEYEKQIGEIEKTHREAGYKDYREMKSRLQETDRLKQVVTLVLYLGEGVWEGRRRLTELMDVDVEVKSLLGSQVQDYEICVIEADKVNPVCYETDLRQFFQALQWRNDKENLYRLIQSPEFLDLGPDAQLAIALHAGMNRIVEKVKEGKVPMIKMCKAVEEWIEEERSIGRQEGLRAGRDEIVKRMLQAGMDEATIIKLTQCSKAELASAAQSR